MSSTSFLPTARALGALEGNEADLAAPLVAFLPVDGAAVSCFGTFFAAETISASDPVVERIDEAQFDLGEGPCWDAVRTQRPVLEPDWKHRAHPAWPSFEEAVEGQPIGALYAFPLSVGTLDIGAIDLYSRTPGILSAEHIMNTERLARIVSRVVLRRAIRLAADDNAELPEGPFSRRAVHNATGVVVAQLRIPPDDAVLLIQGHAYATGATVASVAEAIIDGRLSIPAAPNASKTE